MQGFPYFSAARRKGYDDRMNGIADPALPPALTHDTRGTSETISIAPRESISWNWLYLAISLVFVTLLVGGTFFYQAEEASARRKVYDNLDIVAALKVDQIVQWRRELLGNATDLASQPHLVAAVERWLRRPTADDLATIVTTLTILKGRANLNDAMIVDPDGALRLNLIGHANIIDGTDYETLLAVMRSRHPALTGLHPHVENARPHVDVVAPLVSAGGNVVGAVILETEAETWLYPALASWPTAARTPETLLVRREETTAEILNPPRHQPVDSFTTPLPLDRVEMPAVQAALGREGIFEGIDYRGMPVVAALRRIPDSPWFLVAKMDTAEAYADWTSHSRLLLALMATLALSTIGGLFWLRRRAEDYRQLSVAEAELRHHKANLERTVAERTRQLQHRNAQLDAEVVERRLAESRLQAANERLTNVAAERAAHLRELAGELTQAEQIERDRLYELLHDDVQPLLVAARLGLSGITENTDNPTCVEVATAAREQISEALTTTRTLSRELSPPLIRERGLGPALESLCRLMESYYNLSVDFACDPDAEPADVATRLLCFNAVRELLLNVVKHAGTGTAELNLQLDSPTVLHISVIDRGQGFDASPCQSGDCASLGSGLSSIERRLGMIGGRLAITSWPGQGTIAEIWAPM
jgi:signal transduction histidine kinase